MIYDYPFASHFLKVPGGNLHYLDEGSGPVVTMLHGNPTWSYYFRHLIRELSSNFRVIVPDHMGCGLSDKPGNYPYRLDDHIDNLVRLLNSLDVVSTSLVVHDWGGAIGMGYATRYSERIQRIAILNTAAFRSKRIPLRIRLCRLPIVGEIIVRGFNGFAGPATFMAVKRRLDRRVAAAYLQPYDSWKNRIAIYRFVRDIPLEVTHPSYGSLVAIEEQLKVLRTQQTPMLIVWGGKDFCFNDHFYLEWQKRFPEATCHYLADAGHYVLEDGHGVVEPLIDKFLNPLLRSN